MTSYRIAFIPLARTTFDIPLAEQVSREARAHLQAEGHILVGPEHLVTDIDMARSIGGELSGEALDLLLIFQATFADSTMVNALADYLDAPIFLWAVPEPMTGGRLRLNSFCGINLAGHSLTLRGRSYQFAYASPQDKSVLQQIHISASAGNIRRKLRSARLGIVGEHPAGMDSCHLDENLLGEKLGVHIQHIELESVFERARQIPESELNVVRTGLSKSLKNLDDLDQKSLMSSCGVYSALKQIADENHLLALAVRCWPEFFTQLGCAACGPMSMLSDGFNNSSPLPCSCEADINGSITQLILQWLADAPAFGTDIVAMDLEKDLVALWHCGLAPLSMADPRSEPRAGIHSNRRLPLVMEFPLKAGHITIARLSQASGELRMVIGEGEMISAPAPFSGTSGLFRPKISAGHFFSTLLREGLEHHISLVYGSYLPALEAAAELLGLPLLRLS